MSDRPEFHIFLHIETGRADRKLDQILARLDALGRQESQIMQELDDLTTQVKATDDTEQSALVLINGISDRLAAAGTDPVKLAALTADLKTNSDALAAAVVANTPPAA
jgi:predicted  nucleic acid-binding Zn-ribbon protein